ncbi:MAG TPA: DUF4834 family protein [Candidatus Barnesiella excrementavium]|nr:DUF4834 family protein [Candidatus Barnesiella excrementavium]
MHLAFLLLIILFVIFFVPLLALVQMVVRFISRLFFGRSEGTAGNPFGRQNQNRTQSGRTTWYTNTKKNKKKIDSSEGEYIDFEDIKE